MEPPGVIKGRRRRLVADADRKRVARACDTCRQQKEKCDGHQPCRRCSRIRRPCVFSGKDRSARQLDEAPSKKSPEGSITCVSLSSLACQPESLFSILLTLG
ncbi:unnamed protein product [Clonostachys rhizophaga]|uniref:Zn(2)-C6 fungal-type domain-containing protein n=1 Tax=Clonostachys rhizophaga TaxID=160324 RepID=A0A9N9VQ35_9HYPO|nr:unnamed protein product [Clonostachys rhizophaga]